MSIRIPNNVLAFAGEANINVYKQFADYYNHYRMNNGATGLEVQKTTVTPEGAVVELSFAEKETRINAALMKEIFRVAGIQNTGDVPLQMYGSNPNFKWAAFAVMSMIVDMILPQSLNETIGLYSEIKNVGWGDSAAFNVKPRDLFVVSKVGKAKRTTELKTQFEGQVTLIPEMRALTVFTSLYQVLAGQGMTLAELATKVVASMEQSIALDVYDTFVTAMDALDNTALTGLRVAGYTQAEFLRLSQTVGAWNGGAKPVAIGTLQALGQILPNDANYRYMLDSEYVRLGYVRDFNGVSVMALPQIADWQSPFATKLRNDRIWIISPSSQKLVKVAVEGQTLTRTDEPYANADLLQTMTMYKSWKAAVITNSIGAVITL